MTKKDRHKGSHLLDRQKPTIILVTYLFLVWYKLHYKYIVFVGNWSSEMQNKFITQQKSPYFDMDLNSFFIVQLSI